jgi:hypothetical protein
MPLAAMTDLLAKTPRFCHVFGPREQLTRENDAVREGFEPSVFISRGSRELYPPFLSTRQVFVCEGFGQIRTIELRISARFM